MRGDALLQQLGKKRHVLINDQRHLLASQGHALGRKALRELTTIVAPDSLLRLSVSDCFLGRTRCVGDHGVLGPSITRSTGSRPPLPNVLSNAWTAPSKGFI
jgi:hypothetical protein